MTRKDNSTRRSSQEERRVFRAARLEYVELGRIAGADAAATEFFEAADLASARLLRFEDWSEAGLETPLLCRPPILAGNVDGKADLGWLANAEVLLAAQQHWPAVEDQCSDRVYRIGQTRPVHIYYPLARPA